MPTRRVPPHLDLTLEALRRAAGPRAFQRATTLVAEGAVQELQHDGSQWYGVVLDPKGEAFQPVLGVGSAGPWGLCDCFGAQSYPLCQHVAAMGVMLVMTAPREDQGTARKVH